MICFQCFTHSNLKMHYKNFKNFVVEKGFARRATKEELEQSTERIKWSERGRSRTLNIDEIAFHLCHGKNGMSGRPGTVLNCEGVQNCGEATDKSNYRFTIVPGLTYADEVLPPLIILPSSAEFPEIKIELLKILHQTRGKFGNTIYKLHDCMVAASPRGGMTSELFASYCENLKSYIQTWVMNLEGLY